jgi:hypothetical protein
MAVIEVEICIEGVSALIMHNERLANPLNPIAKEIKKVTDKKKKTEDDSHIVMRLEWIGSLYTHEDNVVMPTRCIRSCFRNGARASKLGKHVERALSFPDLNAKFMYEGPSDIEALYDKGEHIDARLVRVGQSRVLRVRPKFEKWSIVAQGLLLTDVMDPQTLSDIATHSGRIEGLCDNRTNGFGKFTAEIKTI